MKNFGEPHHKQICSSRISGQNMGQKKEKSELCLIWHERHFRYEKRKTLNESRVYLGSLVGQQGIEP